MGGLGEDVRFALRGFVERPRAALAGLAALAAAVLLSALLWRGVDVALLGAPYAAPARAESGAARLRPAHARTPAPCPRLPSVLRSTLTLLSLVR